MEEEELWMAVGGGWVRGVGGDVGGGGLRKAKGFY